MTDFFCLFVCPCYIPGWFIHCVCPSCKKKEFLLPQLSRFFFSYASLLIYFFVFLFYGDIPTSFHPLFRVSLTLEFLSASPLRVCLCFVLHFFIHFVYYVHVQIPILLLLYILMKITACVCWL